MTSVLDVQLFKGAIWQNLSSYFKPLEYIVTEKRFNILLQYDNFNYLVNAIFWIFVLFSVGFFIFYQLFQIILKTSSIHFYKRKQFVRSTWNVAFYSASCFFLFIYNRHILLLYLSKSRYSLFYSLENLIFHKSQQCEIFQFYSLFIVTFYMHSTILDFKESNCLEACSKLMYLLTLIAINVNEYEYYFVGLNLIIGFYNIITEILILLVLQNLKHNIILNQILLGMRIISWAHVFINLLPFQYLVPTLFTKHFKWSLNITIWLWYSLNIWTSPVLQYFYHKIYHNSPMGCSGEGSAVTCILLKHSSEYRHFKTLKKAYFDVKLYHDKLKSMSLGNDDTENSSIKVYQAIKCVITLRRKLKRIRQGHGLEGDNDHELIDYCETSSLAL